MLFRYAAWDGTQEPFELDPDEIMDEMSNDLMHDTSVARALQRLIQRGLGTPNGERVDGLRDLMDRLKARRQELMDRYDMGSVLNGIKERLDDIIETERQGIDKRLTEAHSEAGSDASKQQLMQTLTNMASKHQGTLDQLSQDPAGRIKELSDYDFMDPGAREKFQELMAQLKQRMMEQYFKEMQQSIQGITPEGMDSLRQMLHDLNQMLQRKMQGQPTDQDFQHFMQKHGSAFADTPPSNLDELIQQMADRMAQAQSLLDSMPGETRQQFEEMMRSLVDDDMMNEMTQMAALMDYFDPKDVMRRPYPFSGEDEIALEDAMDLMGELHQNEDMEQQLRTIKGLDDMEAIDEERLREMLGEQSMRSWDQLKQMMKRLEEAGYLRRKGDKLELTPRGVRKIGEKAIRDIFSRLKKDRVGSHETRYRGIGGEHTGETKQWEFGDEFAVDLKRSLLNTVLREGVGVPLQMSPSDFEVQRVEHTTQAATCLLLDRSRSMGYYGSWAAAKKVAIALHTLIRSQYPRDSLYIIGFSDLAVKFDDADLAELNWDTRVSGTNMHHAFMMSRKLLSRHKGSTRQIIMVTDGEPTTHVENGNPYFSYPPSQQTIDLTLKEARRCAQEGVTINTFMLESSQYLLDFVSLLTRINGGRAFYASPDNLGEYVLIDFLNNRKKHVA